MSKRTWTDEQLVKAVKESFSVYGVFKKLGLKIGGGQHAFIKNKIKEFGIDCSHFTGQGWSRGKKLSFKDYPNFVARPLTEILVEQSTKYTTSSLRKRLIREGLLKEICAICGQGPNWLGQRLVLQLDHINGKRQDNRIENLRILCPNCHSQTKTFAGHNKNAGVAK